MVSDPNATAQRPTINLENTFQQPSVGFTGLQMQSEETKIYRETSDLAKSPFNGKNPVTISKFRHALGHTHQNQSSSSEEGSESNYA